MFAGLRGLRPRYCLLPPAYSPDLNPIEMAFAKLKAHFRRIGARTTDALGDAVADILKLCSPEGCKKNQRCWLPSRLRRECFRFNLS